MKNYADKIHAVNAFVAIHAALVEKLTPVLQVAKIKTDGKFDKKTSEKIREVLNGIESNYSENSFRIHCRKSEHVDHIWVECDFYVRTSETSGQYVKQSFCYDMEKASFSPFVKKLISPASVKGAEQRHKELDKLIRELESERSTLRFEYNLNNYGEFL